MSTVFSVVGTINIFLTILAIVALFTIVFMIPKLLRQISSQLDELISLNKNHEND